MSIAEDQINRQKVEFPESWPLCANCALLIDRHFGMRKEVMRVTARMMEVRRENEDLNEDLKAHKRAIKAMTRRLEVRAATNGEDMEELRGELGLAAV